MASDSSTSTDTSEPPAKRCKTDLLHLRPYEYVQAAEKERRMDWYRQFDKGQLADFCKARNLQYHYGKPRDRVSDYRDLLIQDDLYRGHPFIESRDRQLKFMRLPSDVRKRVYELAFRDANVKGRHNQPPLTMVCREVREEALPVYYERAHFKFRMWNEDDQSPVLTPDGGVVCDHNFKTDKYTVHPAMSKYGTKVNRFTLSMRYRSDVSNWAWGGCEEKLVWCRLTIHVDRTDKDRPKVRADLVPLEKIPDKVDNVPVDIPAEMEVWEDRITRVLASNHHTSAAEEGLRELLCYVASSGTAMRCHTW